MVEKCRNIALLIETSRGYGRRFLHGIARFSRLYGPWSFHIVPGDFLHDQAEIRQWNDDGIIARIENAQMAQAIADSNIPAIILDPPTHKIDKSILKKFSWVTPDAESIAAMAYQYFQEHNLKRFGFVGIPGRIWSITRQKAFAELLNAKNLSCDFFAENLKKRSESGRRKQLGDWLKNLPKPVGVFTCNDVCAREVLEACLLTKINVPEEISVLGVDNDELFCEMCCPSLSSIELDAERAGFEAAVLLEKLITRKIRRPQSIIVPPLRVIERRSTDMSAIEDAEVANAIKFIRDNIQRPFGVNDVVTATSLSRRALELRFKTAVGKSINNEILRLRLCRAKQLLSETELSLDDISSQCGFSSCSYMITVFSTNVGIPPAKFRKRLTK